MRHRSLHTASGTDSPNNTQHTHTQHTHTHPYQTPPQVPFIIDTAVDFFYTIFPPVVFFLYLFTQTKTEMAVCETLNEEAGGLCYEAKTGLGENK